MKRAREFSLDIFVDDDDDGIYNTAHAIGMLHNLLFKAKSS